MKHPIEWHEECLKNQRKTYEREKDGVRREILRLARAKRDLRHYEAQVQEAKRLKKDGFDSDKFMRGKKKCPKNP